MIGWICL